jgi:hypothetical protein
VDQGLPQQQVLLWVYGQELRAVFDHVLLAAYHCHYDLREGKVTDIRVGRFYPSPFASRQAQGALLELNPLESVVVYRPKSLMRQASLPFRAEQLWLFERVGIA